MAELPIFPLKVERLLADTGHMSAEEFGSYCRLLFTMWLQGGRLKNNRHELARIAGVTADQWKIIRERVMRPMTVSDGEVSQKRLTDTQIEVQKLRAKRATAAQFRWSKSDKPLKTNEMPHASAFQVHSKCNAIQNQTKNLSSLPGSGRPISAKQLHEMTERERQPSLPIPPVDVKKAGIR